MPTIFSALLAITSLTVGVKLAPTEPTLAGARALLWMATLPATAFVLGVALLAFVRLRLQEDRHPAATRVVERARYLLPSALAVAQVVTLSFCDWRTSVLSIAPAQIPLLAHIFSLTPFALGIVVAHWLHAHAERMCDGVRRVATRRLADGLRALRVVLVPCALLCGAYDAGWYTPTLVTRLSSSLLFSSMAILGASLLFTLASPYLLSLAWPARPLPGGSLRDRFRALENKVSARVREIYVWQSGLTCMTGLFARVRRVYFAQSMLEHSSSDELAVVYAHELGHARRHHLSWYSFIALSFVLLAFSIDGMWLRTSSSFDAILVVIFGCLLVAGWRGLGALSRHFEHEADLFSAAQEGFVASVSTLHSFGLLVDEHQPRMWPHPTLRQRIAVLTRSVDDSTFLPRFHRRSRRLRANVVLFFAVAAGLYSFALTVESRRPRVERLVTEAKHLLDQYERGRLRPWRSTEREQDILARASELIETAGAQQDVAPALQREIESLAKSLRRA